MADAKHTDAPKMRMPSDIAGLDRVLDGGFGRGELALFVGPSEAGKTALACQLATTFVAESGQCGLLVSTSMEHDELERRIVSNFCNAPYRHDLSLRSLTSEQMARHRQLSARMDGKLVFEECPKFPSGSGLPRHIDDAVMTFKQGHGGRIDFVIYDWVGGELTGYSSCEPWQVSGLYVATADYLRTLAQREQIAVVGFCLAHPVQAANKPCVDASMVADCKKLGGQATYVIGISALKAPESEWGRSGRYLPEQFFYCSKGRRTSNEKIPVIRRLDLMRFEGR